MPNGLRKAHTKSRNGCSQCKRRKIKCDEQGPCCGNCQKRGEDCYFEQLGDFIAVKSPAIIPQSEPLPSCPQLRSTRNTGSELISDALTLFPSLLPPTDPNLRDLELMHHYSVSTSLTLGPCPFVDGQQIWQVVVPTEAQSHKFLMHSILAIAALHIAHLRPPTQQIYTGIARAHHGKGLALFRSAITDITPSNSTAAIAFSTLIVTFSLGAPLVADPLQPVSPVDSFIGVLSILRGSWSLLQSTRPWVLDRRIAIMPKHITSLQESVEPALNFLEVFNHSSTDSDRDKRIYRDAIVQLRQYFGILPSRPGSWGNIIVWPVSVAQEFFILLQQKRQMALVILAHWCISIQHTPHTWFIQDWAERVACGVAQLLDSVWKPAMKWPLEVIGVIDKVAPDALLHTFYNV